MTRFGDESEVEERAYLSPRSNHRPLGWEWGVVGELGLDGGGGESSANEAENDPDHYGNTTAARDRLKHFTSVTYRIPGKVGRYGRTVSAYAARWSKLRGRQKKENSVNTASVVGMMTVWGCGVRTMMNGLLRSYIHVWPVTDLFFLAP